MTKKHKHIRESKEGNVELQAFSPLPDYGDKLSMKDFKENCLGGYFINYDGHGNLSDGNSMSNIIIRPSDIINKKKLPTWATHVIWFNK